MTVDIEKLKALTPEHEFSDDERRLYDLMSEISEDCYCAGWMCGNEFALWNAIETGDLRYGMGEMDRNLLAQVAALTVRTGKWIIWRDDHDGLDPHDPSEWGPYSISLKDWSTRRAAPAAGTVEKDAARYRFLKVYWGRRTPILNNLKPAGAVDEAFDAGIDAAIKAHTKAGRDAVPAAAGSIRPAPGQEVARERRRFPESGSE